MSVRIRELRDKTGMTQKAFAEMYRIPVSTLRKWEQGEASPPPYVIDLIARTIPGTNSSLRIIKGREGDIYYYDRSKRQVSDVTGNWIFVREDLEGVKEPNLGIYLHDLYEDFYEIQERFNDDCRLDKTEDIIWS